MFIIVIFVFFFLVFFLKKNGRLCALIAGIMLNKLSNVFKFPDDLSVYYIFLTLGKVNSIELHPKVYQVVG